MEAIRNACKRVGKPRLTGCAIYTSAEPCPMCYSACLWADLEEVYYAADYQDVKKYGRLVTGGRDRGPEPARHAPGTATPM
jgi:guanine deaminase